MCVLWHRPCKGRAVEAIVDGAVDKIVICGERPGDQEVTKIANCCALCTPTRVRSSMICISTICSTTGAFQPWTDEAAVISGFQK